MDLKLEQLDTLAVSLQEAYDASAKGKSFLTKKTTKDKNIKLQLDIVLEIMATKQEDAENASSALEKKQFNAKILDIIARKKEDQLQDLSLAQLEKMLMK